MNLKNLTDQTLIERTDSLVKEEREILTTILHHFREIEARKLFSDFGYQSLFDMAKRRYGYSDDQAYRRIEAMRVLKEHPEIEDKISSGELSLTSLTLARSLFRKEEKLNNQFDKLKKLEILNEIAGKPTREAEKITLSYSSSEACIKPDRIMQITEDKIELKFTASSELQDKISDLKAMLSHKYPNLSLGELVELLCDLGIEHFSPAAPKVREVKIPTKKSEIQLKVRELEIQSFSSKPAKTESVSTSKTIPKTKPLSKAQIRREVFFNAKNQCELCGSKYFPETDHIIPKAKGGSSHPANFRLLCRNCNQRAAIKEFGIEKIEQYLI